MSDSSSFVLLPLSSSGIKKIHQRIRSTKTSEQSNQNQYDMWQVYFITKISIQTEDFSQYRHYRPCEENTPKKQYTYRPVTSR